MKRPNTIDDFKARALRENTDESEIFKALSQAKLKKQKVLLWKFVGERKLVVEVEITDVVGYRNELQIEPSHENDDEVHGILRDTRLINLYIEETQVLFQTRVRAINKNKVVLAIPKMIAQINRRKDLRLEIKDYMHAKVFLYKDNADRNIGTQAFDKKCWDIGGGGVSFLVSKMESKFFQKWDKIKNISITLDDKQVELNGQVVNIIPVKPDNKNKLNYTAYRICIQFIKPNPAVKSFIKEYVFNYYPFDEEDDMYAVNS